MSITLLGLAGCSSTSSETSASAKVCTARSNLRSAVDAVRSDLQSANFGQARDGLSNVQSSFDQLTQAAKDLKTEEQSKLQPQIDAIKSSISNLGNATSLDQVSSELDTIGSQFQTLYNDVTNTLHCS